MLITGKFLLILALLVAAYGIGASVYGARSGSRAFVDSGRRAVYAMAVCLLAAFAILESAFLRSDFSSFLVASHSSTTTPVFYRATAIWSSQEGSLLLWATLLSVWSSVVLYITRRRVRDIAPYATAVLCGFAVFFVGLLVFMESPFKALSPVPPEGVGLNPLLRHPSMMIHPPMLYSGYTMFAIPFAFAVGALITRRLNADWIRITRPFTLTAWFFLGVGIVLGARWSYTELGWGGYWAWDPVENAALMPWLTGTAFLHSVMIQEKRGMLKVWNVSLVLATGVLAILGTFLVRSGILQSIHAFGASTLGVPFLTLIGVMVITSTVLVVLRSKELRSEARLDSWVSREAVFLLNNLVLVAMCVIVFWGTFFPLISEAVTGQQSAVGPPWFDRAIVPAALILVLLTGIGPALAWRRATLANLRRQLTLPAVGALAVLVLVIAVGATKPTSVVFFVVAGFAASVMIQEYVRGVRARRLMVRESVPVALVSLVRRNRRRYGGYLVHLGVITLFVGIAASSTFQRQVDVLLSPGQSTTVKGYKVTYVKPTSAVVAASNGRLERIDLGASLRVDRGGKRVGTLETKRSYFPTMDPSLGPISRFFEGESTSEVGLRAGVLRDIWTVISPSLSSLQPRIAQGDKVFAGPGAKLTGRERSVFLAQALEGLAHSYLQHPPPATFRVLISPLVTWIWLGAIIIFLGALIAIWPGPHTVSRRVTAGYAARLARELGRA
ncbi:MAG: cytochrome c-type biosis protein CcmF [Solirubrobacteraceae bacterium]|nr:cytochrome c-type biosis protein CcmF [Solirubrobacteraceae bacterium]